MNAGIIEILILLCIIILIITLLKYFDYIIKIFDQKELDKEDGTYVFVMTPFLVILITIFATLLINQYINL